VGQQRNIGSRGFVREIGFGTYQQVGSGQMVESREHLMSSKGRIERYLVTPISPSVWLGDVSLKGEIAPTRMAPNLKRA
jgi:hypothetical protein